VRTRAGRGRRRRPSLRVLGLAAIVVLMPAVPAAAEISWRGGFETGTFSEWDTVQAKPGTATVVTSPVRDGRYAARFRVGPGDNPLRCSCGERAELVKHTGEKPGTSSVWAWSAFFPAEFAVRPGKRVVFTQWHDFGAGHPAPVVIRVVSSGGEDRLGLGVQGGPTAHPVVREWTFGRLQRGRWYDFVARFHWAADASGSVELMIDGAWVVPKTTTPTLFVENGAKGVYLKQGVYRATPWSQTTSAYLDATRRGTTLSDVLGPSSPDG
jgi:Polysaccharide lyase